MSEGGETVTVPNPSTEETKPVEEKSKRDSAVIIPSDEESSSHESTEATGSDESEESEESEKEGEAGKESPVKPEHEEHEVEEEDEKPVVTEPVEHKDDAEEVVAPEEKEDEKPVVTEPIEHKDNAEEVVAPKEKEVDEEKETKGEENDEAKKKEMEIPALIEPENKTEEIAKNEGVKDGDEKEEEDGVDDDSISTTVETGEPIEDVPLKQTEESNEGKMDEEKVEEEKAEEEKAEEEKTEEEKVEEKPEENEDYEFATKEEQKPIVEDKETDTAEPAADKEAKQDVPEIEEEKKEEDTAVNEIIPKEAFLENETEAIPKPEIAETEEKASEEVLPEPEGPVTTEAEPPVEIGKDAEEGVEDSAKQEVPETPLEPETKLDPPHPLPVTSKPAPTQLQISKAKFRQALNMLVQLLSEAEDDEGVVRLNLNDRESELRKVVRMLGKRLEGLEEAEQEVEWFGLVGEFEKRGREEQ
jgi:hypothetical protein